MVDVAQHYVDPRTRRSESSWPASYSFPLSRSYKSTESNYGVRTECRGHFERESFRIQPVVCVTLIVPIVFLCGFLCGFVFCIKFSTLNSEIDLKMLQTSYEVQRLKETLTELRRRQDNLVEINQVALQREVGHEF